MLVPRPYDRSELTCLYMFGCRTSSGLSVCFKQFTTLRKLHIEQLKLSSAAFAHIHHLTALTYLKLRSLPKIGNFGVKPLGALVNLKYLDLYDMRLTDVGLQTVRSLTNLEHLCLSHMQIGVFLGAIPLFIPKVQTLHLSLCKSLKTNVLLQELPKLTELRELKIRKVEAFTSEVLTNMKTMSSLSYLNITDCSRLKLTKDVCRHVSW